MVSKFIHKGFTLTEFLVVIAIIGILSVIVFPYYHSARKQLALQRAASKLAFDIRWAQEMAMSVVHAEGCFGPTGEPKFNAYKYGYGISFDKTASDPNTYILFADCNGNGKYQPVDVDIILFNPDLEDVAVDYSSYNKLDIVFEPPDPTVSFSKDLNPVDGASVVLKAKDDPSKTKTITINKAGLISVE